MRENDSIRRKARANEVPLWRVAAAIGVSEPTFTRWLRFPLPKDKKRDILDAISKLAKEAD